MSKVAQVTVERLEQRPPGEGVPAGWLPEVVYHLTAMNVPYRPEKPEYVMSLKPKDQYLLRRLAVAPQDADSWELMVSVGSNYADATVICPRVMCNQFGGGSDSDMPPSASGLARSAYGATCWPPASKPVMIRKGEEIFLTLWRRSVAISKRFECILRGAENSVLPAGEERSILQ